MTSPLVTIVMPAYNAGTFLEETLSSALRQTYGNFELLIADDGSTDDTLQIIESASRRDPRVRLIGHSPHAGPAVARNICLTHAHGEVIALLDSDDIWTPSYLADQLALLNGHPHVSIVTANAVNLGGPLDGRPVWPATSGVVELRGRDLLVHENAVCIMAMFRRSVLSRIAGFDPRFTANEDYEFWLRAVDAGMVILRNHTPLGFYRRRPNSVSSDDIRMLKGIIAVLEETLGMQGALALERPTIRTRLAHFRQEFVKAEMRSYLLKHDAAMAARKLQALSALRGGRRLAFAARVSTTWPQLLDWAYSVRCALRS